MRSTAPLLQTTDFPAIRRARTDTLQMNLGYRCNLSCVHCHVNAGPKRTEEMSAETMAVALELIDAQGIGTLDLTGGSPEMNPHFRWLVRQARQRGLHVIDRCNPTILVESGYEGTGEFLAEQGVEVIASLPCYLEDNVDAQRGRGVFQCSMDALQRLNRLGYGKPGSGLELNLVYNPQGAVLPPPQAPLEEDYRRFLGERFGLAFNRLYTLANMPIQRFGAILLAKDEFESYLALLKQAYRAENLEAVMCRTLLSVDWRGFVYDCDFNQMLQLPAGGAKPIHLRELLHERLEDRPITVGDHCYGCTAGQGSSCGGALHGRDG